MGDSKSGSLGRWEIDIAKRLPELFLKYSSGVLFQSSLARVILPAWQNYTFPDKRTGPLMADWDLIVTVTLC